MEVKKQDSKKLLWNIVFSIVIPILILTKFSDEDSLGPLKALLTAICFPIFYGLYELFRYKKIGFLAIIGLCSVLFTGIIGLLQLPPEWIAIKEAVLPLVFFFTIIVLQFTPFPFIKKIFYNSMFINTEKIEFILRQKDKLPILQKILRNTTYLFASSFLLSSLLNYFLAIWIVKSTPGTVAFNEELAKMTMLSFPVITLPVMVVLIFSFIYFFKKIRKHTGLSTQEIFKTE